MFQGPRRWVALACVVTLTAVILLLLLRSEPRAASKPSGLYIRIDTNGVARILGVPLGDGPGRDITLQALRQAKVPVTVLVPSGGSATRAWDTNFGPTLNAIIKAGLVPTNKPSGPSPYE
jgi:hypothetical protein